MKSLDYLDQIKKDHFLTNEQLIDILEKISYIARDNNYDDSLTEELIEILEE